MNKLGLTFLSMFLNVFFYFLPHFKRFLIHIYDLSVILPCVRLMCLSRGWPLHCRTPSTGLMVIALGLRPMMPRVCCSATPNRHAVKTRLQVTAYCGVVLVLFFPHSEKVQWFVAIWTLTFPEWLQKRTLLTRNRCCPAHNRIAYSVTKSSEQVIVLCKFIFSTNKSASS